MFSGARTYPTCRCAAPLWRTAVPPLARNPLTGRLLSWLVSFHGNVGGRLQSNGFGSVDGHTFSIDVGQRPAKTRNTTGPSEGSRDFYWFKVRTEQSALGWDTTPQTCPDGLVWPGGRLHVVRYGYGSKFNHQRTGLVQVSVYQGSAFCAYPIFDPQPSYFLRGIHFSFCSNGRVGKMCATTASATSAIWRTRSSALAKSCFLFALRGSCLKWELPLLYSGFED